MAANQPQEGQPIHTERHVRIICIGAGASGLLFAYSSCACDVPSHNYTWSFEPKPDWSGTYASSREIFNYFDDFSRKYGLRQYCRPRHEVVGATWDSRTHGYEVRIRHLNNGQEWSDYCDILINAGGILNSWRWPAIPGLDSFKGTLVHTANWDESIVLKGKHVGLIGNGSSGIQVLPAILDEVEKVTTFIREPTWVSPVQGLEQHIFTPQEKDAFAPKPEVLNEYRREIERGLNGQFGIFLRNTKSQKETREYMTETMAQKLQNTGLEKVLIPDWSVGCRRITPGVGYLEALGDRKVEAVYGNITEISQRGCVCDNGKEYPVDVLICATGFDTSFRPRFPIIGPNGNNLQDDWKDEPQSYLGVAAAGIPNYFTFLGPNSPIGNGPVLSAIEAQADYMMRLIDRYQTTNIRSFAPKTEAVSDFVKYKNQFMRNTVWADACRSWYKSNQAEGPITALWPGSTLHYIEAMSEVRLDDFDVQYNGNRFSWMGNGYSQTEIDETADWAYYIRDQDDGKYMSHGKRLRKTNKSGSRQPENSSFSVFPKI